MNLIEGLNIELNRNRELLQIYKKTPNGAVGAALIKVDIERAEKAMAENDIVEMVRTYSALKDAK